MTDRIAPFGFICPEQLDAGEASQFLTVLNHWNAILDELAVAPAATSNREDILGELIREAARELIRGGTTPSDLAAQLRLLAQQAFEPRFAARQVDDSGPDGAESDQVQPIIRLNRSMSVSQAVAYEGAHRPKGVPFGPLQITGIQVLQALWWNETPDAWSPRTGDDPPRTDRPTLKWLAEATLLSPPTIKAAVRRLREHGFLE